MQGGKQGINSRPKIFNYPITNYAIPNFYAGVKEAIDEKKFEVGVAVGTKKMKPGSYQPYKPGLFRWMSAVVCCPTTLQEQTQSSLALLRCLKADRVQAEQHGAARPRRLS